MRGPGECSLWPAPATAVPDRFTLGDTTVSLADHDCDYVLGTPVALPVTRATATRLLFHFDVNGDGVDDLFVGPDPDAADASTPVTLLVSSVEDGALSFSAADCGVPWEVSNGSYFVRDLDGDGTGDVVIGRHDGVRVMLSREGGLVTTLDYEFADGPNAYASLMDVAAGDFDGDGHTDLAVGYDRVLNELSVEAGLEMGSVVFSNVAHASGGSKPTWSRLTPWGLGPVPSLQPWELGYLTSFDRGTALFGVVYGDAVTAGWIHRASDDQGVYLAPGFTTTPTFVGSTRAGGAEVLVVGTGDTIVVFDPKAPEGARAFPSKYTHGLDRELGGGARYRNHYLLDLDGDGDGDLVESSRGSTVVENPMAELAVYPGAPDGIGQTPEIVALPSFWYGYGLESPFVKAGKAEGRLLVLANDDPAADTALMVAALGCQ